MQFWHGFITFGLITSLTTTEGDGKNLTETYVNMTKGLSQNIPLDLETVLSDASNVFRKIVGGMMSKKRLVGLDSEWYW